MDCTWDFVSDLSIEVLNEHLPEIMYSYHSGQICIAGSRIFVQEGIYDRFIQTFTAVAQSFKFGDGFDPESNQGPLISETQMKVRDSIRCGIDSDFIILTLASDGLH